MVLPMAESQAGHGDYGYEGPNTDVKRGLHEGCSPLTTPADGTQLTTETW